MCSSNCTEVAAASLEEIDTLLAIMLLLMLQQLMRFARLGIISVTFR